MSDATTQNLLSAWCGHCVDAGVIADAALVDAFAQPKFAAHDGELLPSQVQVNRSALVAAMGKRVIFRKALQLEAAFLKGMLQRIALRLKLMRFGLCLCLSLLRLSHLSPQEVKVLFRHLMQIRACHDRLKKLDGFFKIRHPINLRVLVWVLVGR